MEPIKGFEGFYEIHLVGPDNTPAVWSYISNRYIRLRVDRHGYHCVDLWKNKVRKTHKIHRLVAMHFINNPNDYPAVDHIDGNRQNNQLQNLRWVTNQQNQHNRTKAKGYTWHKRDKKWQSYIRVDGKLIHGGLFDNEDEARARYLELKKQYHIIE